VGKEVKASHVLPEYRWFDGTSQVYNIGEKLSPNPDGTYTMARANGEAFDGKSQIVPIKNHWSVMPLSDDGQVVPPVIMRMFMTGSFDGAIRSGMNEQGMSGGYSMVNANAEMLLSHGVDPKSAAPSCGECHAGTGKSDLMIPFSDLGYHTFPAKVANCTLCHEKESLNWESVHNRHVRSERLSCTQCHTTEPTGFIKPAQQLCASCHRYEEPEDRDELHEEHIEKGLTCKSCHTF
jgi:hypothetical protein